jgi:hypothetical protein
MFERGWDDTKVLASAAKGLNQDRKDDEAHDLVMVGETRPDCACNDMSLFIHRHHWYGTGKD